MLALVENELNDVDGLLIMGKIKPFMLRIGISTREFLSSMPFLHCNLQK